jgi:hypothetical protein
MNKNNKNLNLRPETRFAEHSVDLSRFGATQPAPGRAPAAPDAPDIALLSPAVAPLTRTAGKASVG